MVETVSPRILSGEQNAKPHRGDDREHHAYDKRYPRRAVLERSFRRVDLYTICGQSIIRNCSQYSSVRERERYNG
jgi:hypothetical protein